MGTQGALTGIRGVVFDMDGTLTVSPLDFDVIRRECGMPRGQPILEFLRTAPAEQTARAWAVLERHERRAAEECTLRDGAREVLETLRRRGIKTALLTRNSAEAVRIVLGRFGLSLDCWVSREDAEPKPSPAPVLHIARRLGLEPDQLLVVGDYVFDVQSGREAGAATAFLKTEKPMDPPEEADLVLGTLDEILANLPESILAEPER